MFDLGNIDFIKTDQQRGRKSYSFVGLKRKENSERLEFWLPLGFDTFETDMNNPASFDRVKKFFFKMYRTFQTYRERKLNQLSEEERTKDRDGVFEFENGFSFVNGNNEQVIFYGKLNALDKILEGYDELRISSLEKKQIRSHEIDYSKIHRYMHQAIYLNDDDIIYLDEMNIAKNVLIQDSPPIIQLFCFIYTEIKKELEEFDSVPDRAFELAEKFKDSYLQPDSSLFSENTFADTIDTLKNVFEEIDSKTTYKDEDFWHFYEAIEAFLMGERLEDDNGVYFGINNFYDIWEDMCQSYMLSNSDYLPKVLFADVKGKLAARRDLGLEPQLEVNPFKLEINRGFTPRFLKPDLVYLQKLDLGGNDKVLSRLFRTETISVGTYTNYKVNFTKVALKYESINRIYQSYLEKNNKYIEKNRDEYFANILGIHFDSFILDVLTEINRLQELNVLNFIITGLAESEIKIIDYKYMRQSDYQLYNPNIIDENGENKIKEDILKQLIYEWAVQENFQNSATQSEFWIPYHSDELAFETFKNDITEEIYAQNKEFEKSQINIIKINFKTLQEYYIKLSNAL